MIDQGDIKKLKARVDQFQRKNALTRAVGEVARNDVLLNFRRSAGPDGRAWKPLAPITLAMRRNNSKKPLSDTRRLRNSITAKATEDEAVVGTNVKYAKVQHFGATIRPVRAPALAYGGNGFFVKSQKSVIPARPFMGIGDRMVRKINRAIEAWAKGAGSAG